MHDRRRRTQPRRARGRYRYHGFTLGNSEEDRAIAHFIDSYDGDLAQLVKGFLYEQATGRRPNDLEQIRRLLEYLSDRIDHLVENGVSVEPPRGDNDRTHNALSNFQT